MEPTKAQEEGCAPAGGRGRAQDMRRLCERQQITGHGDGEALVNILSVRYPEKLLVSFSEIYT